MHSTGFWRYWKTLPSLEGEEDLPLPPGRSTLGLILERELNGQVYTCPKRTIDVRGISPSDNESRFVFTAETRVVEGVDRWSVGIVLYSQFISNNLLVSEVQVTFDFITSWIMRTPDGVKIPFTVTSNTRVLTPRPVFNKEWWFYSDAASTPGPSPVVKISFKLTCQP
jgi:hypothetical protein